MSIDVRIIMLAYDLLRSYSRDLREEIEINYQQVNSLNGQSINLPSSLLLSSHG